MNGVVVVVGLAGLMVLYRFFAWFITSPVKPDPWENEIDQAVRASDALPLCSKCLAPQTIDERFCPECGHSVSPGDSWNPYINLRSMGEGIWDRTGEKLQDKKVILVGYGLLLVTKWIVVVPAYLFFLLKDIFKKRKATMPQSEVGGQW